MIQLIILVVIFSLNEYVNAGIEAVKIPDEFAPHYASQATPSKQPIPNYVTNPNHYQIDQMPNCSQADAPFSPESIADDTPSSADNEPVNSSDEKANTSEQTTCTDPYLPTLPSYEESQQPMDSSKLMPDSTEMDSSNEDLDEQTLSSESEDSEHTTGDEKTNDVETDVPTVDDSVELRTELSSVIPPTSISLEVTPSHETDTAFNDINGDSSKLLAREPTVEAKVESRDDKPNGDHVTDDHRQIAERQRHVLASNERFIKPITFETAATMDDVSDTELESYLQELEDLEENSVGLKAKVNAVKSAMDSVKEEIEGGSGESAYNIDQTIDMSKDDRNADSFSQASTVEFGEVNTNSSIDQTQNAPSEQNTEAVKVADSVLDTEMTRDVSEIPNFSYDDQIEDPTSLQAVTTTDLDENAAERDLSSEMEPHTECSECELDQHVNHVARRPNSLDLPNCNSVLVESQSMASSSAMHFSSEENAGNTPGACKQFMSSSISSDDSNLDTNQMIVSRNLSSKLR